MTRFSGFYIHNYLRPIVFVKIFLFVVLIIFLSSVDLKKRRNLNYFGGRKRPKYIDYECTTVYL